MSMLDRRALLAGGAAVAAAPIGAVLPIVDPDVALLNAVASKVARMAEHAFAGSKAWCEVRVASEWMGICVAVRWPGLEPNNGWAFALMLESVKHGYWREMAEASLPKLRRVAERDLRYQASL